jgi:hypothetical protein
MSAQSSRHLVLHESAASKRAWFKPQRERVAPYTPAEGKQEPLEQEHLEIHRNKLIAVDKEQAVVATYGLSHILGLTELTAQGQ